jgi:hypothetical protein
MKLDVKGAQTAVVCLQSTEESVLVRACDSLFKFAEKSDGNKLLLHEMGATDTLFTLTHHENVLVQQNATMAFGILAAHGNDECTRTTSILFIVFVLVFALYLADVRRHLRKIDCISHMVSLLSAERTSVHLLKRTYRRYLFYIGFDE